MEAIKRNSKVDLAAKNNDWGKGWVISNVNNEVLWSHEALDSGPTIKAKFTDGKQHIAFNGSGRSRTNNSNSVAQSGHIQLSIGKHFRLIVINFLGHARVCNPDVDQACNVNGSDQE
jgi:type IV fimbrial biogenesis protein FimT